jgi:hypothetical protein
MEIDNTKPLELKNIIEKFTIEGNFKIGSALLYMESENKKLTTRVDALEEAMQFFSEWYNKTQRANIILPDNLDESGNTKLIL